MTPLRKLGSAALLAAIASCSGTTGGALVTLPFKSGGAQVSSTFTTATGWTVTLQTALIALGPFYFTISPPSQALATSGVVIIQATEQVVVDALNPNLQNVPGGADGETGTSIAAVIGLNPPDSTQSPSLQALLGTNVGLVAGTATKGGTTVQFSGPIAINPNLASAAVPLAYLEQVSGALADLTFLASPQVLELRVDPTSWFDAVDFSLLLRGSPSNGVYTWDVSDCSGQSFAQTAQCEFLDTLLQGVQSETGVYLFQLAIP